MSGEVEVEGRGDYAALLPDLVPGTDGPALVTLMKMDKAGWDAFTRSSRCTRSRGRRSAVPRVTSL